jgi:hypothetical protein
VGLFGGVEAGLDRCDGGKEEIARNDL